VLLTFTLTIFATFLTRSGLIESVHSFAENTKIAFIFLGFMGMLIAGGAVLILARLPKLQSENQIESFLSRESAFLFNNLILLGATFAVAWGTLLPLLSEWLTGEKIGVGPAFFNRVNIPIGLVLLALVGIGPVIAWRRASRRNLEKAFLLPLTVGAGVMAVFAALGSREWMALATFGISAFVLAVIVIEFWKGTKARARIEGEGYSAAFLHLIARNRRRWGGYIVHVGVVLIFTAFAGAAWNERIEQTMLPGETAEITSPLGHTYRLTYESMSPSLIVPESPASRNLRWQAVAFFSVTRDGKPIGPIRTEKRLYQVPQQLMTEVGIRSWPIPRIGPMEDLYVILEVFEDQEGLLLDPNSSQQATFTFLVNPLVSFIWLGCLVLALGGMIAMWPEPERLRKGVLKDAGALAPSTPVSAAAD
jgi:cytochrome c-type biogenesis protein CcmF